MSIYADYFDDMETQIAADPAVQVDPGRAAPLPRAGTVLYHRDLGRLVIEANGRRFRDEPTPNTPHAVCRLRSAAHLGVWVFASHSHLATRTTQTGETVTLQGRSRRPLRWITVGPDELAHVLRRALAIQGVAEPLVEVESRIEHWGRGA